MLTNRSSLSWLLIAGLVLVAAGPVLDAAPLQEPAPSESKEEARLVDLNTASAAELQALPGIGAATAARIIEYREQHGPFTKVEELMNIRGIGERSFLRLQPLVTVTPGAPDRRAGGGRS